ncbi:ankyrin repeat and SOCS box protein 16-like [Meleagris gallopavo]|uniref:ankyrin repeat and SOCS box protein 16-like n=1 Tax=Meleagris gallopavo TaxID=9103 RepID=UPI000549CA4C|nr:ankyrin repeat and SOCS box protein 16-like [Meleagris gallopavo]
MVLETVSEELVWSPEQGLWVLSPRTQQTSALRIAAARGYEECARHLLLCGAEVDAVVGGRGALHDSVAAPRPSSARLLLSFGADPNLLSSDGSAPLHLCTAPDSLQYAPPLPRQTPPLPRQTPPPHLHATLRPSCAPPIRSAR